MNTSFTRGQTPNFMKLLSIGLPMAANEVLSVRDAFRGHEICCEMDLKQTLLEFLVVQPARINCPAEFQI